MNKKIVCFLTIVIILFLSHPAVADSGKVNVSLPSFPITLNGVQIDSSYSQYPIIVYHGISYFPMTFYDSRFMGIDTKWSENNGLDIEKTGVFVEYKGYPGTEKNEETYQASTKIRTG